MDGGQRRVIRGTGNAARDVTMTEPTSPMTRPPQRICIDVTARFRVLNPSPPRPVAVRAEAIAAAIRAADGNVWPAVVTFGIDYHHALRIRRGWRPGGQHAPPIPYRSRGHLSGRRPGWSAFVDELEEDRRQFAGLAFSGNSCCAFRHRLSPALAPRSRPRSRFAGQRSGRRRGPFCVGGRA